MRQFGEQLAIVVKENMNVLVGMDANGRNRLWDNQIIQNQFSTNRRMGDLLLDIINENYLEVLSDGSATYQTESCCSALVVTIYKSDESASWKIINDEIRSDHSAILIQIGNDK